MLKITDIESKQKLQYMSTTLQEHLQEHQERLKVSKVNNTPYSTLVMQMHRGNEATVIVKKDFKNNAHTQSGGKGRRFN